MNELKRSIIIIAHDIRSTHNVGSLLRTADGLGIDKCYLSGVTPYPIMQSDTRLPHIARKIDKDIHKTALGAESYISWEYWGSAVECLVKLKNNGYTIAALEQNPESIALPDYSAPHKIALVLGNEVSGVSPEVLAQCDLYLEIPMLGRKESFNVVQAAAMALYQFRYF